jgi:hypothetical protein
MVEAGRDDLTDQQALAPRFRVANPWRGGENHQRPSITQAPNRRLREVNDPQGRMGRIRCHVGIKLGQVTTRGAITEDLADQI